MADLGKIVMTNHGDYDEAVTYEKLSCVRYGNAYWISTQTTIGNEPLESSEFWKLIVRDGVDANEELNTHIADTTVHMTAEEKEKLASLNITTSTTDLEDGTSELATGTLYLVYE